MRESIVLGTQLTLGMTRAEVSDKLGSAYRLSEASPGWFFVQSNVSPIILGSLSFSDGRLVVVQKTWGSIATGEAGSSFAESVYEAVASFVQEGRQACTLEVSQATQPDRWSKDRVIRNGSKSISMSVIHVNGLGTSASIEEVLKAR